MITTVRTNKVGPAMFEAMKHGVSAEYLGDGIIVFDTGAIEKISLIVEKLGATIISEEDIVPMTPYSQELNGQDAYAVYRRMA